MLARGYELAEAARWAREIASEAVGHGLRDIGRGPGPVDVLGHRNAPAAERAARHNRRR